MFFQHTNLSLSSHMSRVKHSLCNKVMHMCCKWVQMGSCREGRHLVWALVLALALVQEPEQRWSLLELQPAVQTGKEKICLHVDVNKRVDVKQCSFLTYALDGGEWWVSHILCFTLGTHWVGGWVGPRAGLGRLENLNFLLHPVNTISLAKTLDIEHVRQNIIVKYKYTIDMSKILVYYIKTQGQ